ncbi:MAG TPA: hypothetical protein VMH37_02135, partial [Candidatus Binataceae bacterium]|nr:hypothetical protein [Candidatus Binataceae bacterium]
SVAKCGGGVADVVTGRGGGNTAPPILWRTEVTTPEAFSLSFGEKAPSWRGVLGPGGAKLLASALRAG